MKKKLIYILLVIATVLILAGPALAEGDKVMSNIQNQWQYQYGGHTRP